MMHFVFTKSTKMTPKIFDQKTIWGIRKSKIYAGFKFVKMDSNKFLEESYR